MTEINHPTKTIWWVLGTGDTELPYVAGSTLPEQETTSPYPVVFQTENEQEWIEWLVEHGIDPDNPYGES